MAGLGGVYYAGQQGGIGANDVQFIGSLTLLLFVAIWGIRTLTGALLGGLTAAALPVLQTHLPSSLADLTGLAAGIGIIVLANFPDGLLGIPWLTDRVSLPFADQCRTASRSCSTRRWPVPPEASAETVGDCALVVENVSVHFGGVAALSDVTLRAEAGQVTGLIGPNGAGKTTLFNVISGLQRPDRGAVHLAGTEVTRKGTHRRARLGLARTFQRLELFSTLSATDNVRVGLEAGGKAEAAERGGPARPGGSGRGGPRAGVVAAHRFGPPGRTGPGPLDRPQGAPARRAVLGSRRARVRDARPPAHLAGRGRPGRRHRRARHRPRAAGLRHRARPRLRPGDRQRHARRDQARPGRAGGLPGSRHRGGRGRRDGGSGRSG